jgi:molecular chaperone GrpE
MEKTRHWWQRKPRDMSESTSDNTSSSASAETPQQAQSTGAVTPDELEDLRARAAKADDSWDRLLRLTADFDNYKKRAAREREDAKKAATESVITRLLGVVDSFEMAMLAAAQPNTTLETLKAGVVMIQGQLRSTLSELGLEEVNALDQPFDPALHEAVSQQECADRPEGQVLQQLRKGYKLRDRLLRPASVVVAKAPSTNP